MSATARRRAALQKVLADQGLDALLVTDLINIRYLTGFTGSNAALLVRVVGESVFCTDGRYETQSAAEVPDLTRRIDRPCDLALLAAAGGRVGFEAALVSVAAHRDQVKAAADAELVETVDLVEQLRAVKDEGEIDSLRTACAVADRALADLISDGGLRPGRTEREVGLDLDERMRRLGASDPAFETIVAAGANSAIPHHRPTSAPLRRGDLLKLDFGAAVGGYHSDMTRTFVLGNPADWQVEIYQLVAEAQRAGREAAVVGAIGGDVDQAARSVITDAGYGPQFSHGLGHGIGLQVHEAPSLARAQPGIIRADMCVTVEPGVYLPGRGGVRIEDSGVVRAPENDQGVPGYEVLTLTSRDLVVL
ncbi:Xaa-Pro aminopeptidase [Nakamurella panacisegetis]|uniref:Xaa-Pro aminopeptidase n=1 Tax=Nakamurella panacisegetis TaxID=1090615 RepID=A0A1H0I8S5_9ACTN|nr:Xaa-Pro peptidase family protein [Nakamurella panacisegetis]SDO27807.1 Xaa-Pro aminopeptidase [Nakamurella panacisegetis]